MNLVLDQSNDVARWAAGKLQTTFSPPFYAIGIASDNGLCGAAIFNEFAGDNVEISVVGKGAFSRGIMRALANYAFEQNGCKRISITVRADNEHVVYLAEKFGFVREGIRRQFYGDVDAIIFGMLKSELPAWIVPAKESENDEITIPA